MIDSHSFAHYDDVERDSLGNRFTYAHYECIEGCDTPVSSLGRRCKQCRQDLIERNRCPQCGFDLWSEWHEDNPGRICGGCEELNAGIIP